MSEGCNVLQTLTAALCCFYHRSSVIGVKFSKDQCIMEGTPDKLKKELEEELKLSSEELRSHAWYHGHIPRQVAERLLRRDGDFLIRDSLSSPGNFVLTCQWKNSPQHFKINKIFVRPNEAFSCVQYQFEQESFDSVPALVRYYVGNRKAVSQRSGAIIFQPINRTLPLRCIEEKYGVYAVRQIQCYLPEENNEAVKRLSLNMVNGNSQEHTLTRGNLLRNKDKCGSQPARLDNIPEKRRPLKAHQSESYLPLGSRVHPPSPGTQPQPKSPVFRTGSEPALSPTVIRRVTFEPQAGEALRGSDSQLCPKPPPKPSKVPYLRPPQSPSIQCSPNYCEVIPTSPIDSGHTKETCLQNSYVERLKTEENKKTAFKKSETNFSVTERNTFQPSMDTLEDQNEEDGGFAYIRPVFETESVFKPNCFVSMLLPSENRPLETLMLKRVKELLVNNDPRTIAKHILQVDCKVARTLDVSEEMKGMMGVNTGLELITLPHGHQLRLDLIERHSTMAIGVAVDILGCTGNVEERASALNKIIQVAVELKESMGDLYAFSAVMKALDMPQITRLEQTWTTLRHKHTQTAITYEKSLKPFIKALHEGSDLKLTNTTLPLLMPLVTLMERQAVIFEGMDLWENNDQSCEIMLNHLDSARTVAENAELYRINAEKIIKDFKPDEEVIEIFKTEFQMRLLWGSKGAQVNQTERYEKFNLILAALSKKLEPPVRHTEL
ncbi:breast cancer anti-estrogen resistance protein 3 isoform X2 [Latimeria chalumnae]|uniref:BCAR3 adaptor protein, NSP family member n=1 Tax=Latimeria chalumnae TaxID=7897 RepID=H2ZXW6_LATCH|nr:PREDICTED: breast cancer anti-estrogen resistance protein 3 homolog [Latimeria chalumnae]|eukprot:XP_006013670.1 PREDICTED: breast cancer anti-estrogen resistance protein 3 homolog [Latimeria chalumnae]